MATKKSPTAPRQDKPLALPEKVSLKWLLDHVPLGIWIGAVSVLGTAYSLGVASANTSVIQAIFARDTRLKLADFQSKAITEKGTYVIDVGASSITLFVQDVSIARQVLVVKAGITHGTMSEPISVAPNQVGVIPVGPRVYELVVHDLARASFGQDIAVVSLAQRSEATVAKPQASLRP